MAIRIAVKIVQLKVCIISSQSDDLALHTRSQLRLKLDTSLFLYFNSNISDNHLFQSAY